jgi:hypothetical protein
MNPPSHGNIKLNIGKKNNNSINVNAQPNNNKESKLLAEKL